MEGETLDEASVDPVDAVGEYDTETDLVLAFLSRNNETAFTRSEVVRGVAFGETEPSDSVLDALLKLPDQLVDIAGDLVASGIVVDDVSTALDQLVEDGVVERRRIERGDGEETVYYRLAE